MSEKNLEFLKDALKYLGFGEGLNEKLTENVKVRETGISIEHHEHIRKG